MRQLHLQSGVTLIEYALIASLVAVGTIGILTTVGADLNTIFTAVSTALQGAASAGGGSGS